MGGGNALHQAKTIVGYGLSPRGRGKPGYTYAQISDRRSIPAWAGETLVLGLIGGPEKVYPRVGGGNDYKTGQVKDFAGLSPRGRGKQDLPGPVLDRERSIPAWAGETPAQRSRL